ncbi:Hypothetical predicted protein [Pelobates cultripes]|uniref:Uncharacterized protein n=1 Tax=Pelobates cultripes TaxID=61616 RepID=A0AAD1QZW7_PELCU|nr:Hypothetical predicted protein [Pelobates cultripes]
MNGVFTVISGGGNPVDSAGGGCRHKQRLSAYQVFPLEWPPGSTGKLPANAAGQSENARPLVQGGRREKRGKTRPAYCKWPQCRAAVIAHARAGSGFRALAPRNGRRGSQRATKNG